MSRNMIVALTVAATAFFAGVASSWLIGQRIADRAMDEFTRHMTWEPEGRVRVSVTTLKLLQRGDVAEAIRLNCNMARSSLPLLGYADRIPERKKSMDSLASDAEQVLGGLETAGKCGPR